MENESGKENSCEDDAVRAVSGEQDLTLLDKWLIKRYLEKKESRVYKLFMAFENNFMTKLLEYEMIGGMTTGRFQKRVGRALSRDPLEYTMWSIFFGLGLSMVKYIYAHLAEGAAFIDFTSDPVEWWGHILFLSNFFRYAYVKIIREPIPAPYIWPLSLFFYIRQSLFKRAGSGA
jgi:hypothetical protein